MQSRFVFLAFAFSALLLPAGLRAQSAPLPPGTRVDEPSAPAQAQTGPLAQAESLIDGKDCDKARGLLDTYLSTHSSDARALFDRGYCDDMQGRTDSAKTYYRKAIAA